MTNDLVTILPAEFFNQVMGAKDMNPLALEALRKYPDILSSRLIIMPMICKSQFTLYAVSNPMGIIKSDHLSRGVPFMMNLHPGGEATRPKRKDTSRRLRLFLNKLAEFDTDLCVTKKPFTSKNLQMVEPRGKTYRTSSISLNLSGMKLTVVYIRPCQFPNNTALRITASRYSNWFMR